MALARKRVKSPSMQLYLDELDGEARLSPDDERSLADAIAAGDAGARSRMIRANLRLVVTIASAFTGRGLGLDDLVAEGNLGLIRATKDYDPAFGTRFGTYAAHWIKQSIRVALLSTA